jgi:hypothetical protein
MLRGFSGTDCCAGATVGSVRGTGISLLAVVVGETGVVAIAGESFPEFDKTFGRKGKGFFLSAVGNPVGSR